MSSQWLGGSGGSERAVSAIVGALRTSHVDVLAAEHIRSGYYIEPERGSVPHRLRWRCPTKHSHAVQRVWRLAQPIVGFRPEPYDLHIHFASGSPVHEQFRARVRAVVPAGGPIDAIEGDYGAVFAEAPSNAMFVADATKLVHMPPPVVAADDCEMVGGLPSEFMLTVFNPFGRVKGTDLLHAVAADSPLPVVWCHSTATRNWNIDTALLEHPNIIHVVDATPAKLRYLYERCVTYVSLSLSEGFGWAIADALLYGAPIISRRTGVLTISDIDLRGVSFYESTGELHDLVRTIGAGRLERSLEAITERAFIARLSAWYSNTT